MWLVWLIAYFAAGNPLVIPSFSETALCFFKNLGDGEFWLALLNTFWRTLAAFAVSFVLALFCASLSALSKSVKAFFKPVMAFIRTLPTLAVILIILKATSGNKVLSPIIVTFLVLFPLSYTGFCTAFSAFTEELKEMAQVYRVSAKDKLFKIYLPLAAPQVFERAGSDVSLGLKIMISAEVLASTAKGLGGMMQLSNIAAETANLAALTLAAVLAGLAVEIAFSQLKRIAFKWNVKEKADV